MEPPESNRSSGDARGSGREIAQRQSDAGVAAETTPSTLSGSTGKASTPSQRSLAGTGGDAEEGSLGDGYLSHASSTATPHTSMAGTGDSRSAGDASAMSPPSAKNEDSAEGLPSTSAPRVSRPSSNASLSKTTNSADAFVDVIPEALSYEQLEEAIRVLERDNLLMKLENDVLEGKLGREQPELLEGLSMTSGSGGGATVDLVMSRGSASVTASGFGSLPGPSTGVTFGEVHEVVDSPSASRSRSKATGSSTSEPASRRSQGDRVPTMSLSQRVNLAEEAVSLAREGGEATREHAAMVSTSLRAQIEEAGARLQDTRLARHQLDQISTPQFGTGRVTAERFIRFLADWTKSADATIERLRLKTSSLRLHHKRVRADLAVKRELGEALRPVDFEKIRIEIREMGKKIDNKNMHLIDLKNISGGTTGRLLSGKKKLVDLSRKLHDIHKETAAKRAQISALEGEERKVLQDVARADVALNAIRFRMERHTAPDLLGYVHMKGELNTLRKEVVVWGRRCKIQQQTERDMRRELRALAAQGTRTPDQTAGRGGYRAGSATDTTTSSTSSGSPRPRGRRRSRRSRRRSRSETRSDSAESGGTGSSCPSSHSSASLRTARVRIA